VHVTDLKIRKWREKLDTERIISLVTLKQNMGERLKERKATCPGDPCSFITL
jgi:hypothetical protein